MMLPAGWSVTPLKDVCNLLNGRAYKQHELLDSGLYPVLRVGNFFSNRKWYYSDLELDDNKYCDTGDLLYAWSASFGPRIWEGGKVIFHYHIWRTQLDERALDKRFLYHWFEWDKENIKREHGTGSTMIHVTKGDMEERGIALPPLAEQRRIVAKVDALIARIASARTDLSRAATLATRLKKQAMETCFASSAAENIVMLGTVLRGIVCGKNLRCEERPPKVDERGVVKVSAVTWGRFDPTKSKTLPRDYNPPEVARIRAGDLLISRANTLELVGAVAIVNDEPINLFLSDKVLRLLVDDNAKKWVLWFLRSPNGRRQIEQLATGNQLSMRNISQEALRRIRLPFPNIVRRDELIATMETTFTRAERLEAEAARVSTLLDRLEASVLDKAFLGELVPQDSTEESALILLEQIRAEQAFTPVRCTVTVSVASSWRDFD